MLTTAIVLTVTVVGPSISSTPLHWCSAFSFTVVVRVITLTSLHSAQTIPSDVIRGRQEIESHLCRRLYKNRTAVRQSPELDEGQFFGPYPHKLWPNQPDPHFGADVEWLVTRPDPVWRYASPDFVSKMTFCLANVNVALFHYSFDQKHHKKTEKFTHCILDILTRPDPTLPVSIPAADAPSLSVDQTSGQSTTAHQL